MKSGSLAIAAAIATGVVADHQHARRHAHQAFHMEGKRALVLTTGVAPEPTCGCTTIYSTYYGSSTIYFPPYEAETTAPAAPSPTPSGPPTVPTDYVTVFPTPGTYTIPATTITLTSQVVVDCTPGPSTYPAGTYTQSGETVTVTQTSLVYVCPFTTQAPEPAVTTAAVKIESVPSPVAAPIIAAAVSKIEEVVSKVSDVVTPTKATKPSGGQIQSTNDEPLGITYTPYKPNGDCKDAAGVMTDIGLISKAGFDVIRLYSPDCNALANVGAACKKHGVKIIMGVFIKADGVSGVAQQQVAEIVAWAQWDLVVLMIVGNEALMQGFATPSALAGFISSSKSAFAGAGYTGPVSTAEPVQYWIDHADVLCNVIDLVAGNIHAFFDPNTSASEAGKFVKGQLDTLDALCPGKYAINTESGWPSAGICNGKACPGQDNQAIAIKSIKDAIGIKSIVFSMYDDTWKAPGPLDCEQHWGIIQLWE